MFNSHGDQVENGNFLNHWCQTYGPRAKTGPLRG